jgi:DNA-binding NarL/FixJ family response regulator
VNVVVIEDDSRYRASLETLFRHAPGYRVLACHGSAIEAVRAAEAADGEPVWDLVLADLDLPGMNGIEATRRIKRVMPRTRVVVLTVFEEPATILEAICAGADGYLLKRTPPGELLEALESVAAGGAPLTAEVARTVLGLVRESNPGLPASSPERDEHLRLTDREREVLRALVRGLAYKQVAGELDISIDTVRTHIRGVYRKLQVHSVAEAVSRAIRERLT